MPIEPNPYDDEKLAQIRKDQEDPIVQYLIVRKSLGMGVGKIAAQTNHATKMLMLRYTYFCLRNGYLDVEEMQKYLAIVDWIKESFRTVVLGANDKQWEKVKEDVDVFLVKDAGLTEVPAKSETAMSTWPMRKSTRPKILAKLQALK